MTEQEYRENRELREQLRQLLDAPALKFAVAVISDKAKARMFHEPKAGVHLDTLVSQHYNRLTGIQYALDTLNRLTQPNQEVSEDFQEPEFFHALPEEMQRAIKERKLQ